MPAYDAGRGRDRDDDLDGRDLVEQATQLARRSQNLKAVHAHAALARVVVDEADRGLPQLGAALHLARDELTCLAGADDQHLLALREHCPPRRPFHHAADRNANSADQRRGQQQVHRGHRARQVVVGG